MGLARARSLFVLAVLATSALAADPVALLRVGDFVPNLGTVTSLGTRVTVDDSGSWCVLASSGSTSAVVSDGQVALRTGDPVTNPAGATITAIRSFAVNSAGQPVWLVDLSTGGSGVYWGSALALRTGTTPLSTLWPTGSTYGSFRHAQPNGSNQFLLLGSVNDPNQGPTDFLSVVSVNAGGQATSENLRARVGSFAGSLVIDSVPVRPEQAALEDAGGIGDGGGVVFTLSMSGQSKLVRTSNFCPSLGSPCSILLQSGAPGPSGELLGSLYGAGVGANSVGAWVAKVRAGSTSSVRICVRIGSATTQFCAEGGTVSGITPWTIQTIPFDGPVFVPETNQVIWYCNWSDPDTTRDEGIFRDSSLLVQEGVTTAGGTVIQSLDAYGFAVCESGRYLVFRGRLAGSVEAAFLLDLVPATPFCFGDGSGTPCPCANHSPSGQGRGCLNSFGTGALHSATGLASVSADTVTLHLVDSSPTGQAPTFFQGTAQSNGGAGAAFGDGLRCAIGTTIRLGTRPSVNGAVDFGFGVPGDPLVHVQGLVGSGAVRHYQVLYRNATTFCTTSTFNTSNGVTITWGP